MIVTTYTSSGDSFHNSKTRLINIRTLSLVNYFFWSWSLLLFFFSSKVSFETSLQSILLSLAHTLRNQINTMAVAGVNCI